MLVDELYNPGFLFLPRLRAREEIFGHDDRLLKDFSFILHGYDLGAGAGVGAGAGAAAGFSAIADWTMSRQRLSPSGIPSSRAMTLTLYLAELSEDRVFSLFAETDP